MILFFDTETTGLPDYRLPVDHEDQPRLVQMACLLTDNDGKELSSLSMIIDPAAPIPLAASAVHGITTDLADRAGISSPRAVALWDDLASRADLLVAHNIKFDLAIMSTAWARVLSARRPTLAGCHEQRAKFCTMEAASPIVNLPPTARMVAAGFNKPKPPKLEECIQHFFAERLDGAHDALVDVRACARLFFRLKNLTEQAA